MISFFPSIYADELVYSVIARYHQRSGYALLVSTLDDIYQHRTVRPDFEFLNSYTDDALFWLTKNMTLEEVIMNHTMYQYYAHFLPVDRKEKAFDALCKLEGNWSNLLSIRREERYFRYCPMCANEDRKTYGETYWHRIHQIQRLRVCPLHNCYLSNTDISVARKQAPSLYNAENVIPKDVVPKECSQIEGELATYVYEVLSSPVRFKNVNIGRFLYSNLSGKYLSSGRVVKYLNLIYRDFYNFYDGVDTPSESQIQKIFNGASQDAYYICQVAFWEGIRAKDMATCIIPSMDNELEKLYYELSEKYKLDVDMISQIGAEISNYLYKSNRIHNKPSRISLNYAALDEEYLPKVREFVNEIYHKAGRPEKLSISKVEKALSLPQKRISRLPNCKAYILQHMESLNEFWAREVIWAVKEIQKTESPMNWKHIRNLINIRKTDLLSCSNYIKDKEVKIIIHNIINNF